MPFCCDLDPLVVIWDAAGNLLAFKNLADGSLGVVPPVAVEVRALGTSVCFGQTFGAGDVTTSTALELKAKAD